MLQSISESFLGLSPPGILELPTRGPLLGKSSQENFNIACYIQYLKVSWVWVRLGSWNFQREDPSWENLVKKNLTLHVTINIWKFLEFESAWGFLFFRKKDRVTLNFSNYKEKINIQISNDSKSSSTGESPLGGSSWNQLPCGPHRFLSRRTALA